MFVHGTQGSVWGNKNIGRSDEKRAAPLIRPSKPTCFRRATPSPCTRRRNGFIPADDYTTIDIGTASPGASDYADGDRQLRRFRQRGRLLGSMVDFNIVAQ
jgi:hypothetical protein